MLKYDAQALQRLERMYNTPQIREQRRRLRAIVAARPGERGLDIGCGAGHLSVELAAEVGTAGRIVAVDSSADSVGVCRERVEREGCAAQVEVRQVDATTLDGAGDSFDFAVAAQVYSYVPDVARAVRQAAQALRPGGRLIVLDTDWDMCVWRSSEPQLSRRMAAARGAVQFAHAHLPRELPRLLADAGLRLDDAQVIAIVETTYDPESFGANIIDGTCDAAREAGIAPGEIDAWAQDLRARRDSGEWFFCLNRFVFTARRRLDER
ncbi:MAG TPA: methyltransferase domain-containing protein [Burkholderiaceae bacterium]|nr:methyltransferase domain-containing protein [Burkholderiaceae bacterium]